MNRETAARLVQLKHKLLEFPCKITAAYNSDAAILMSMGMVEDVPGNIYARTCLGELVLAILEGKVPIPINYLLRDNIES